MLFSKISILTRKKLLPIGLKVLIEKKKFALSLKRFLNLTTSFCFDIENI